MPTVTDVQPRTSGSTRYIVCDVQGRQCLTPESQPDNMNLAFLVKLDPNSGQEFYVNIFTKTKSWDLPDPDAERVGEETREKTTPEFPTPPERVDFDGTVYTLTGDGDVRYVPQHLPVDPASVHCWRPVYDAAGGVFVYENCATGSHVARLPPIRFYCEAVRFFHTDGAFADALTARRGDERRLAEELSIRHGSPAFPDNPVALRAVVELCLRRHAASRLDGMDALLAEWDGREMGLLDSLWREYGELPRTTRDRARAMYAQYCPSELDHCDAQVDQYATRDEELIAALEYKFGTEPIRGDEPIEAILHRIRCHLRKYDPTLYAEAGEDVLARHRGAEVPLLELLVRHYGPEMDEVEREEFLRAMDTQKEAMTGVAVLTSMDATGEGNTVAETEGAEEEKEEEDRTNNNNNIEEDKDNLGADWDPADEWTADNTATQVQNSAETPEAPQDSEQWIEKEEHQWEEPIQEEPMKRPDLATQEEPPRGSAWNAHEKESTISEKEDEKMKKMPREVVPPQQEETTNPYKPMEKQTPQPLDAMHGPIDATGPRNGNTRGDEPSPPKEENPADTPPLEDASPAASARADTLLSRATLLDSERRLRSEEFHRQQHRLEEDEKRLARELDAHRRLVALESEKRWREDASRVAAIARTAAVEAAHEVAKMRSAREEQSAAERLAADRRGEALRAENGRLLARLAETRRRCELELRGMRIHLEEVRQRAAALRREAEVRVLRDGQSLAAEREAMRRAHVRAVAEAEETGERALRAERTAHAAALAEMAQRLHAAEAEVTKKTSEWEEMRAAQNRSQRNRRERAAQTEETNVESTTAAAAATTAFVPSSSSSSSSSSCSSTSSSALLAAAREAEAEALRAVSALRVALATRETERDAARATAATLRGRVAELEVMVERLELRQIAIADLPVCVRVNDGGGNAADITEDLKKANCALAEAKEESAMLKREVRDLRSLLAVYMSNAR